MFTTLEGDVSYEERPISILDSRDQVLREKVIPLVKVQWQQHGLKKQLGSEKRRFGPNTWI